MLGTKKRGRNGEPTPGGDLFTESTPTPDIKAALKAERGSGGSAKAALTWLACLWRRDVGGGLGIARDLDRPVSTARAWLSGVSRHGFSAKHDGLARQPRGGAREWQTGGRRGAA